MTKTRSFKQVVSVLVVVMGALAIGGCGSDGSGSGGGGSGGSAGGSGGTGGGGTGGTGGSDAVAACEAAAKAAGDKCAAEADRKCLFDAYVTMCATENAAAIQAEMECFTTDVCHTFSDPGEDVVKSCLDAAYTAQATDASNAVLGVYCGSCASNTNCPSDAASGIPFSTLSEATLSELKSCMDAAAGCMAMDACLTTTLTEIAACF